MKIWQWRENVIHDNKKDDTDDHGKEKNNNPVGEKWRKS